MHVTCSKAACFATVQCAWLQWGRCHSAPGLQCWRCCDCVVQTVYRQRPELLVNTCRAETFIRTDIAVIQGHSCVDCNIQLAFLQRFGVDSMRAVRTGHSCPAPNARFDQRRKRASVACSAVKDRVKSIMDLCATTDRGVTTSAETKNAILAEVKELCAQTGDVETTGTDLSATWKLIWTTEKVSLWYVACSVNWDGSLSASVPALRPVPWVTRWLGHHGG